MKTYRVSRPFLALRAVLKVALTALAASLYVQAVTHPTPLGYRLLLLAGIALVGWLLYVRAPRVPTEITLSDDGWVEFRSRRDATRLRAADILSVARGFRPGTVRVRHAGGRLGLPDRFAGFYEFLAALKAQNPAIRVRGF